jgi:hypothetical protein
MGIQNNTFDFWGAQIEAGSTMTDFVTASGNSPQAELAMCQRYCFVKSTTGQSLGLGTWYSATIFRVPTWLPVQMRTAPSVTSTSGTNYYSVIGVGASAAYSSIGTADLDVNQATLNITTAGGTAGQSAWAILNAGAAITFSAEF